MSDAAKNYLQIKADEIEKKLKKLHINKTAMSLSLLFSFFCYTVLMYLSITDKISFIEYGLLIVITFLFVLFVITYCKSKFYERCVELQNDMIEFILLAIEHPNDALKIEFKKVDYENLKK